MRMRAFLTGAMILIAGGGASAIRSLACATLAPPPAAATISIDELQSRVDAASLPELDIENLF